MEQREEQEILVKIAELTEQMKVANHRIQDLEDTTKRIESLTLSVEKLALSVEHMASEQLDYRTKQGEIAKRLLDVEQSSVKDKATKYDKYASQIASLVIGAVIGYLLFTFFGL